MPDIRQNGAVIDDFNRASYPENPIQYTAEHPWITPFFSQAPCQITGPPGSLGGTDVGNSSNMAVYEGLVMNPDRGNPETWGTVFGSYTFPEGTRQGLITAGGDGYQFLETGGFSAFLRKFTGGSIESQPAQVGGDGVYTSTGRLQLMRLTPTLVEIWRTSTEGDYENWSLTASYADTSYRNNLMPWYGTTGNEDGWLDIGGGPLSRTQIYRWVKATRGVAP